ncbi:uncharacterized protein LOC115741241 [Rhodamnia argentea]|uniref:Uncharacterized protein LOC115741241 n=1 Tax=Rhodamnia argentea TaxID=178133 RepID=A0A8B8P873_9MYRT|nr:uncharacterized protein LOC115741241 [Rhodamnia argentea]XP_030530909.1 uncharacterized protein LOC115741241 [Rhodamnia argentea]XP_048139324.1 uncharacterized protein LOC115741241 [Rhodamnia argentea]XP_048139325.1 uncharacterized protein LOC115741241 [Rhodamnia argentea]XP_048139326.1 uncharacterized protein LOC115741241 [Rhodamnia argentea]
MAAGEGLDLQSLKTQLSQTPEMWKQEMAQMESRVDALQVKLQAVKACLHGSEEDERKELEVLWERVNNIAKLLTYLKSKAMVMPELLLHESFGVKQLEGVAFIDRSDGPLPSLSRDVDLSLIVRSDGEDSSSGTAKQRGCFNEKDVAYIDELLKSVQIVTDFMESLVKRVLLAESEIAIEKEKVTFGQLEIKRKAAQIESMSLKLEEMERFAVGTNNILNEMRLRVEDLVEETSRQRQRAEENEVELCRVKRDFESLKSYVSSLITVRETLLSSEKQFQTMEKLFERLMAKTTQLESEKMQKEVEVKKLMEDNVRLTMLLDKKEAQLMALNEQCKVMALSSLNI